MQGKALPGFRDFYPEELALRNHIFAVWRSVARRYGFEEYDGPPLEPLEIYTQKSGEEIVEQLYAFEDKGGRKVALRPEMTPTLARMVGERAQALKKPIRWFAIPQLFRYERQQRGRLREHFQLNMDVIGEAGPAADAEVMAAALDIMRAFGLGPAEVRLRISDRRVVVAKLRHSHHVAADELVPVLAALDKWERAPADSERLLTDALRADRARVRPVLEFMSGLRDGAAELRESAAAEPLRKLAHELRDHGVAVEYGLRHAAIRKQLELAAARGAPRAVIVGPDERAASEVVVRDLNAGTEEKVPVARLLNGFFR